MGAGLRGAIREDRDDLKLFTDKSWRRGRGLKHGGKESRSYLLNSMYHLARDSEAKARHIKAMVAEAKRRKAGAEAKIRELLAAREKERQRIDRDYLPQIERWKNYMKEMDAALAEAKRH